MRHETKEHCGRVEIIASCFEIATLLACERKRAAANSLLGVVVCAHQNTPTSVGFHFKIIIMTTLSRNHKNTVKYFNKSFCFTFFKKNINVPLLRNIVFSTLQSTCTMPSYSTATTSLLVKNLDLQ